MDMEIMFLFELKDQDIKLSVQVTDLRVKLDNYLIVFELSADTLFARNG